MGKFSDVLLTVDYDRTLTGRNAAIPARNIEAIRYFMAEGGAFTVNTGRSLPMFSMCIDSVPVNVPLLLYNGSAAYEHGQLTQQHVIPLDLHKTMAELVQMCPDLNVELQGIDAHYCFREDPHYHAFYDAIGCPHATAQPGQDLGPFLKFSIFGTIHEGTVAQLFESTPEETHRFDMLEKELRVRYGDAVEVFRAAPRIIDVHAKGVSKNRAARELQQRLGRKILVCVGDAENDVPMLEGADFAFCPADGAVAERFPNVCPCDAGAVADVIYKKIPDICKKALDISPESC